MITDHGSLTLGAILPQTAAATVSINVACGVTMPDLQARLTAILAFAPVLHLSFAAQLTIATQIVASIQAMIAAVPPIEPPSLDLQVTAAADLRLLLEGQLDLLAAQLQIAIDINALLANGSIRMLTYSGPQDDFGSELSAELGGATTASNAIVLLTSNGTSWAAMQTIFGV